MGWQFSRVTPAHGLFEKIDGGSEFQVVHPVASGLEQTLDCGQPLLMNRQFGRPRTVKKPAKAFFLRKRNESRGAYRLRPPSEKNDVVDVALVGGLYVRQRFRSNFNRGFPVAHFHAAA